MSVTENLSPEIIAGIIRKSNSVNVYSKANGGIRLSTDPLNLSGKFLPSDSGYTNSQAIGLKQNKDGSLTLTTKSEHSNKPAQLFKSETLAANASKQDTDNFLKGAAKDGYRPDLQQALAKRVALYQKAHRRQRGRTAATAKKTTA